MSKFNTNGLSDEEIKKRSEELSDQLVKGASIDISGDPNQIIKRDIDQEQYQKIQAISKKKKNARYHQYALTGIPAPLALAPDLKAYPPTVRQILEMTEDEFHQILLPFTATIDGIMQGQDPKVIKEMKDQYQMFDLFFLKNEDGRVLDGLFNEDSIAFLKKCIEFIYRNVEIQYLEGRDKIIIKEKDSGKDGYVLNRKIFKAMCEQVHQVSLTSYMTKEDKKDYKSEYLRQNAQLISEGDKRVAERNKIHIEGIINLVAWGGPSYVSMDEILNMTYYRLIKSYETIQAMINYNTVVPYMSREGFDAKKAKVTHWHDTVVLKSKDKVKY